MRSNSHANRTSEPPGAGGTMVANPGGLAPADLARERLFEAGEFLKTVVMARPALALGAALAAGVVVGWMIKRR
jgi:hypothetical protein